MKIKFNRDDVFVAELQVKRLARKLANARQLYREINGNRNVELVWEHIPQRLQKLFTAHFDRVAAMSESGELDEAKAKRDAVLAEKDRHSLLGPL
ncbi:hypothetical protein [Bradyrhizobium sp.]|uniref:hypothetical protein n=1 Tax=Bradyrhizobium sp. TaxID=376 RepID=UPI001DFD3B72|nr:hypothetical protein [Bradyrhizobium sp.]MBI5320886.1 hypothetical protein [Bradyrhizobium sp.]